MTRKEMLNIKTVLQELVNNTTIELGGAKDSISALNISYRLDKQKDALISIVEELKK